MYRFLLCITLLSGCSLLSIAQEKKVFKEINRVMTLAQTGKFIAPEPFVYEGQNALTTINKAISYTMDSNIVVRNQAYLLIHKVGLSNTENALALKAVDYLAKGCHDRVLGIALYCSKALQQYDRKFFTPAVKNSIGSALFPGTRTVPNIARLIGWLAIEEQVGRLQSIAYRAGETKINRWYAHLALSRMGKERSIEYILSEYQKQPVNTTLVEAMVPDLLYTRQPIIYDAIFKLLYDEEKACVSLNPNNERKIHCGYLLIEQISLYLEEYPLETHASGALKGQNYDRALERIKSWLSQKEYTISGDKF